MEAWASYYNRVAPKTIRFICVCVESQEVAKLFDSIIRFENACNAYIPSRQYLPVGYGQLGCSGFVIADQQANFVSRKTQRYLDFGEGAFRQVEAILQHELDALHLTQKSPLGAPVVRTVMEGRSREIEATKASTGNKRKLTEPEEEKKEVSLEERLGVFLDDHGTGIGSVDHEHEECINSLQQLLKRPSVEELETAIDILKAHFQSEESMMQEHGFGGNINSSFSAIHSHIKDHEKIIELGLVELKRIQAMSAPSCGGDGKAAA